MVIKIEVIFHKIWLRDDNLFSRVKDRLQDYIEATPAPTVITISSGENLSLLKVLR